MGHISKTEKMLREEFLYLITTVEYLEKRRGIVEQMIIGQAKYKKNQAVVVISGKDNGVVLYKEMSWATGECIYIVSKKNGKGLARCKECEIEAKEQK